MMNAKNESIDLFYYYELLWKSKWFIIITVGIVSIFAVVLALSLPKKFSSTAVLLPPGSSSSNSILGMMSNLPLGNFMGGSSDETNSILAILKSRTLLENIVKKFDLVEYYGTDNVTEARILLSEDMNIEELEEGTIGITFHASTSWFHPDDEERASINLSNNLAKFCFAELDRINKTLKTEEASFNRAFVERRYEENLEELRASEDSLKMFQEMYGVVELEKQVEGSISTAIKMQEMIILKEVELRVAEKTLSEGHPTISNLQREIEELQNSLDSLGKSPFGTGENQLLLKISEMPSLGLQWIRLKRNVEIQHQIFTFLTQQYEEAKLKEARDTPTVQLLDEPVQAEIKTSPRRTRMVILSFLLAGISSVLYVIVMSNSGLTSLQRD